MPDKKKKFKDTTFGKILLGAAHVINPALGKLLEGVVSPKEAIQAITESKISVEDKIKEAVKVDRAKVQFGKISRFGLLEMSRQRLRPSLKDSSEEICHLCDGIGRIRNIKSMSLSILRLIEEESLKA